MKLLKRLAASNFFHSFRRDPLALVSSFVLLLLVIASFGAPVLAPNDPYDQSTIDIMDAELPPVWMEGDADPRFLLGTDPQGRGMLSTMLYGMRVSILIGLGAVFLQALIGIVVGLTAGYRGGRLDAFLMRMADVQLSFSTYMVAIFISAIFQGLFGMGVYADYALVLLILIIGFAEWPQYARRPRHAAVTPLARLAYQIGV